MEKQTRKRAGEYFKCLQCDTEFYRRPSCIKKGQNKYCSKKCFLLNNPMFNKSSVDKRIKTVKDKKIYCGENNNRWKGGISSENNKIRASKRYSEWRLSVFERDLYTCQECNAKSTKGNSVYLNAHHKKPFALYPELRFEIDNGETLCKKCHNKKPKGHEIYK